MSAPKWFVATLAKQLEMNAQTWRALQDRGVTERSALSLDFSYVAPDGAAAERLRASLADQTDYAVQVHQQKKGLLRKTWIVEGTTQPTPVSLDVLNDWVRWMIAAGAEKGECIFDGWGTAVPS